MMPLSPRFNRKVSIVMAHLLLMNTSVLVPFVDCFAQQQQRQMLHFVHVSESNNADSISSPEPAFRQRSGTSIREQQRQQQQRFNNNDKPTTTTATKPTTKKRRNNPGKRERQAKMLLNPDYVPPPKLPYHADYATSIVSQKLIAESAQNTYTNSKTPLQCATAVLVTFLAISPQQCNAANVVHALVLSAKTLGMSGTNEHFRSLLFRTNNILFQLLQTKLDKNPYPSSLTPRQLANAVWALGKHYDRDEKILPPLPSVTALEGEGISDSRTTFVRGTAEIWDLRDDLTGDTTTHRVDKTIDEIARQLIIILRQDKNLVKESEICMACWAYGVLRRRRRPPGWLHTPQIRKLSIPTAMSSTVKYVNEGGSCNSTSDKVNFIKFEKWKTTATRMSTSSILENVDESPSVVPSESTITGEFLDAVGYALTCDINGTSLDNSTGLTNYSGRIRECSWMEMANVAWAFAAHGHASSQEAERLLNMIAQEATSRLKLEASKGTTQSKLLSRDLSQIVWALGVLQADNFRLGEAMVHFVDTVSQVAQRSDASIDFPRWSWEDIGQFTSALAHARIDNVFLVDSLYKEASRRLDSNAVQIDRGVKFSSWKAWELTLLLWTQARLYLTETRGPIYREFPKQAILNIYEAFQNHNTFQSIGIGPQEQANLAWSITVLDLYKQPEAVELTRAIYKEAAETCERDGVMQVEHTHQLWQSYFILQDECPSCIKEIPVWFRDYLQQQWSIEKARPKISSARHLSISKTLNLMGVSHYNEHDEDIDVAIVLKAGANWTHETETNEIQAGMRVAVEFDGPYHFTRLSNSTQGGRKAEPPRALGHTVLKYRLLKKQGWTVVRVPYYEYDKIPFWASMERQRYLQRLLKTHVTLRFSRADGSAYKAQVPNRGSRFD